MHIIVDIFAQLLLQLIDSLYWRYFYIFKILYQTCINNSDISYEICLVKIQYIDVDVL